MKILYVAGVGKYGTYILTRNIFTIWIKQGYKIVFVGPIPDKLMLEFVYKHRIPVYFLALARIFRLDQALKLAMIARHEKIDVIHACNLPPGRFLCRVAALLANKPIVLYIGTPSEVYNANRIICLLQKFLHCWAILTSQGRIAMSQYLAYQLYSSLKIPRDLKTVVIPMGVNLALIRKKNYLDLDYRHNRSNSSIRVVQVARLAPEKGQDIILKAVKEIFQKGYKISIDFIGDESCPGYRNYLYNLITGLNLPNDALNFLGYHPAEQVYQELSDYDIFLHPSRSEGQGIAVLEAMAAGLPVVASEAGGLKELVVHQETGLLVPIEDHKVLAEAIIWLIKNPTKRIEMGEAGYQRVKEKFSLQVTESKTIKFYEHLSSSLKDGLRAIRRIIYFQQNLSVGACEEYFYLLMQGMNKTKFEIIFVCPENKILDSLVTRLEILGIKIYRYSLDISNYRLILHLNYFFRKFEPDLIHFNDPCLNGIIAARLANVPILLMTHHTPELNRQYNLKGKILERIIFQGIRPYVIFTSEYDRDTGIKKDKIQPDKSFVIYYGLPPQRFQQEYDRKEIYSEFSFDEECHIIGNIGRLSTQKGQSYLIEAAPLMIEKFKAVKFFFVGEGELESELKTQVQEKGLQDYFIFTGYRTDIPRLLNAFEMLVMPSLFEGLCFAIIEASAMGVPVVATRVGGMRRSVIHAKTGLLIPPGDSKALAESILWMLGHPQEAKEMGLAGRKHFEELFTQDRMIKKTEELYRTIIKIKSNK